MENKKGFTLAEILITLTIIGVVAALTIPTLINNINEAQYNASVKNTFSTLSNALGMIQSNNQGIIHVSDGGYSCASLRNDFCNVMSCTQFGYTGSILHYTIIDTVNNGFYSYKDATNKGWFIGFYATSSAAILNNGSIVAFSDQTNNGACDFLDGYFTDTNIGLCDYIFVDINGAQGPNMVGQDFYVFYLIQNQSTGVYSIVPAGAPGDLYYGPDAGDPCDVGADGWACTYQRLYYPNNMP